jgi:GDP-mannose 6-dehydrogenase
MKAAVFGLGYVGAVSAACLSRDRHDVVGVDLNVTKVRAVQTGHSPVIEDGLDALVAEGVRSGRLRATVDGMSAVRNSDVSIICVGTPSLENGNLKLEYVENVCREIGAALAHQPDYHVVVVRSTVLPGSVHDRLIPILEETSGRSAGKDFGVCMNPEFLREGTGIQDYYKPSQIIIGEYDERSGETVQALYEGIEAAVVRTKIETAEMVKYTSNAYHALKVAFANEIASVCKSHQVDGREVMEIFCRDRRLNISTAYLKPGYAFGGSCLPKDLRALLYRAKERDLDTPLLRATLESNDVQIRRGIALVEQSARKHVAVLGLSFKAGTDDVRESPVVPLIETLVGRGYQVAVYDEQVDPERLIGANKLFLERELPHIASLMRSSIEQTVADAEAVVVTNTSPSFSGVAGMLREDQVLIDLVGAMRVSGDLKGRYAGIGW